MAERHDSEYTSKSIGVDTPLIATLGIASAILVLGVVVPLVQALVYTLDRRHEEQAVVEARSNELIAHQLDEQEALTQYAFVNEQQGIVRIPIDRAMRKYVERRGGTGR